MKRGGPLRRKTRIRAVNPERKAKRYARDFGDLAAYIRERSCCTCGKSGPSDPAHVKSRGAGGHAWTDGGSGNIIPLCRACHGLQHAKGWAALADEMNPGFCMPPHWAEYLAADYGREFLEQGGER